MVAPASSMMGGATYPVLESVGFCGGVRHVVVRGEGGVLGSYLLALSLWWFLLGVFFGVVVFSLMFFRGCFVSWLYLGALVERMLAFYVLLCVFRSRFCWCFCLLCILFILFI